MHLRGSSNQRSKDHRRGARIVEGGVSRRHVEAELLHQPCQTGGLALLKLEHEPGEGRGVDDRVLERAFEPPAHQPGVECVVAVLDENCAMGESKKRPSCVAKFWRADQHRTVDVVPLLGIGVDRRPAIDERVEEGKRAGQLESFGAQLEHQERGVPRRLHIDGDELGVVKRRLRAKLRRVDRDLLPGNRLRRPSRLEVNGLHDRRPSNAARRNCISWRVIALRSTTAAA
jgi:hypothetical protein